jgi:hypothetical protein
VFTGQLLDRSGRFEPDRPTEICRPSDHAGSLRL